jgi:hypothetical protein
MSVKENDVEAKSVCGACGATEVVALDGKGMDPLPGSTPGQWMEPDGAGFIKKRRRAKRRMRTIGAVAATHPKGKSAEEGEEVAIDAAPTLEEINDMAAEVFGVKVVDSGYGEAGDLFIVQMQKDDEYYEAIFDGKSARMLNWAVLDSDLIGLKTGEPSTTVGPAEVTELALKTIQGEVINVVTDTYEGQEVWVAEMTGEDGNDHDIYVSLDGVVVGSDTYEVGLKSDPAADATTPPEAAPVAPEVSPDALPAEDDAVAPVDELAPVAPAPDEVVDSSDAGDATLEKSAVVTPAFMALVAEFQSLETS